MSMWQLFVFTVIGGSGLKWESRIYLQECIFQRFFLFFEVEVNFPIIISLISWKNWAISNWSYVQLDFCLYNIASHFSLPNGFSSMIIKRLLFIYYTGKKSLFFVYKHIQRNVDFKKKL